MSNLVTGIISPAIITLLAALGLLFLTASATLELKREAGRVDGTLRRYMLFDWLRVERVELTRIRGARENDLHRYGQVELDTDQGTVKITRLSVNKNQAGQLYRGVERFLNDPGRDRILLVQESHLGSAKVFGYLLLCFSVLIMGVVADKVGWGFLSGLLSATGFCLVPAVALLFHSASATLELKRSGAGVDAMLHRHALFGWLNVERIELNKLLKANFLNDAQVVLATDQGFIPVTRSALDKTAASQTTDRINVFLGDATQDSLVVVLETRLGLAKAFGYIFTFLILLTMVYLLLPGKSPPQGS